MYSSLLVRFHSSFILPDNISSTVSCGTRMHLFSKPLSVTGQLLNSCYTLPLGMNVFHKIAYSLMLLPLYIHLGQVSAEFLFMFLSALFHYLTDREKETGAGGIWKKQRRRKVQIIYSRW